MRRLIQVVVSAALAIGYGLAAAQAEPVALGDLFSDHMVLPARGAVIFGTAEPGAQVTASFGPARQTARADDGGHFHLTLPDSAYGTRGDLTVSDPAGHQATASDVIAGDVFLCSGQSNMWLPVTRSLNYDLMINSSANDQLRMATIPIAGSAVARDHFARPVAWQKASPVTVGNWSAACYYFGRELQKKRGIPVGLVHASLGGTSITAWLDSAALQDEPAHAATARLIDLYAADPAQAGLAFGHQFETWWAAQGGADSPWRTPPAAVKTWTPVRDITLPWQSWGLPQFETYVGALWYGRTVHLTPAQARQPATLDLGAIADIDITWVNGQPAGFTSGKATLRTYALPAGALKAGDNTVIVNADGLEQQGGLYGQAPRRLRLGDGTAIALDTGWGWLAVPPAQTIPPRAPWDWIGGPTTLRNAMIRPMGPFPFRAALWYQGEADAGTTDYQSLLTRLFADWREQFGADMSFAVVQLANFGPRTFAPVASGWAELREQQRRAVIADGNAALTVAIDLGEPTDIHPANKNVLGLRLSRAIEARVYGAAQSASGPMIERVTRDHGRIAVSFTGIDGHLVAYGGDHPVGFEVCTATQCRYAEADIRGATILLPDDPAATHVRFCWADAPVCSLYDAANDLPAGPFDVPIT